MMRPRSPSTVAEQMENEPSTTQLKNPSLIAKSTDISGEGNFPQGCSFSPDGLCILTSTAGDNRLRLYNTPTSEGELDTPTEWQTALSIKGGDSVRSYSWYPRMNSSNAATCCFLGASRDQPIHLYDAYTGRVRATYRPFNAMDEMESPTVVSFSPDGQHVYAGGFRSDRTIHVFDTAVPGRDSTVLRLGKTRRSSDGQKGLVSAMAFSPRIYNHVFCVGTYAPGSIYVYDERLPSGNAAAIVLQGVCVVGHGKGHSRKKRRFVAPAEETEQETDIFSAAKVKWFHARARGGVTQLAFSPSNDYTLYSASRRSDSILAWDLRMVSGNEDYKSFPIRGIASCATSSDTNQRIEFDFDEHGRRLFVGGLDRCVRTYDVQSGKLLGKLEGLDDVANGVSYTLSGNVGLLAVATGARRFPEESDEDDDNDDRTIATNEPGSIELYKLDNPAQATQQ